MASLFPAQRCVRCLQLVDADDAVCVFLEEFFSGREYEAVAHADIAVCAENLR